MVFPNSADNPVPVAEDFLLVVRWRGPPSHGVRSYMTLILRSHVTLCSEKTRINIAVRGRVKNYKRFTFKLGSVELNHLWFILIS
jgi:hypothetical protein